MVEVVANNSKAVVVVDRERTATVQDRRTDAVIARETGEPRLIESDRGPRGLKGEPGEFDGTTDDLVEGTQHLFFTPDRASAAAPVQTVNGKFGDVVLSSDDIGADPAGTALAAASASMSTHVSHPDPHPQYLAASEAIDGGNF